jgi:hypothetical protein
VAAWSLQPTGATSSARTGRQVVDRHECDTVVAL